MTTVKTPSRSAALSIAVGGFAAVLAYAAWAVAQILWWNPLAAASGRTYPQIMADLAAAGESLNVPAAVGIMAVGPAIALGLLVAAVFGWPPDPWPIAHGILALLVFGPAAYFCASFGAGMALADTYMISGADASPLALPLFAVSIAALVAWIAVPSWHALARRRDSAGVVG